MDGWFIITLKRIWWFNSKSLLLQRSSYQRESEQRRHTAWRNPWWFAVSSGRIPLPWAAADLGCQRSGVVWPELPSEHPPSSRLTAPPENSAEDGGKVRKVEQSRGKCIPGQSRHDQVSCNFRLWVCNCCHTDTLMYTYITCVRYFFFLNLFIYFFDKNSVLGWLISSMALNEYLVSKMFCSFYSFMTWKWHVYNTGSGTHWDWFPVGVHHGLWVGGHILLKKGKLKEWSEVIRGFFCFL